MMNTLGIYVHIPFCRSKCAYCDFVSYAGRANIYRDYVRAVLQEAAYSRDLRADTLYIGGGTPTALGPELLVTLLDELGRVIVLNPRCEITVEANPGTVDFAFLCALRGRGVNRLSLGVQTFDNAALALLGRIHTVEDAVRAARDARRAGFRNINLDIMFGLPSQSARDFERTLNQALDLVPEHLSLYALTLEENTRLARDIDAGCVPMPDPDLAAEMYEIAQETLGERGYIHYEISNWARAPQYVCAHNLRYWCREPYMGLGVGAHSFVSGLRFRNTNSPEEYIGLMAHASSNQGPSQGLLPGPAAVEVEPISNEAAMAETMFLGLRMLEGVRYTVFRELFGVEMTEVYGPEIAELAQLGLLEVDAVRVRLSERGRLLGNQAFERFLRGS